MSVPAVATTLETKGTKGSSAANLKKRYEGDPTLIERVHNKLHCKPSFYHSIPSASNSFVLDVCTLDRLRKRVPLHSSPTPTDIYVTSSRPLSSYVKRANTMLFAQKYVSIVH
jgi:hypothetical protein